MVYKPAYLPEIKDEKVHLPRCLMDHANNRVSDFYLENSVHLLPSKKKIIENK